MLIVHRHIIKEIARHFYIIILTVIGIYLAVDFFEKIDDFIEAGLGFPAALRFFVFKIPFIAAQITPVGILLSVLTTFALMSRRNEIIALKSAGAPPRHILAPALAVGLAASFILFFISEAVVPITMDKANRIWFHDVRKESGLVSDQTDIWLKKGAAIAHIQRYHIHENAMFQITINEFDENFAIKKRMDAQKGEFTKDKKWLLYKVMTQTFGPGGNTGVRFDEKKKEDLNFAPEDIRRIARKSEEMNFSALYRYMKKIESEGYDATRYRVDLYAKFSFPFVCVIMCLAGIGVGLRKRVRDALPAGMAFGIALAFFYWVFYSFCLSLGYGKILSPLVSVLSPNMVFLCFGIYLAADSK
ncbi:LPS export ABC transporter permease LptG [Candidatus Desulfarcum epimagneticum]|uniref:LPS export ABC transporter permease LptG n=1 Tax=uncultured Desulfobacteraceae bacterium TaxID=218296 RepID=A0A484HHG7_9BACT|nr:LPS export ABC transporter permease LptG [uncultured Desulfobacteraceae bacterium]